MNAYSAAFTRGLAHGVVSAVHLPENLCDIPNETLLKLHVDERAYAQGLSGHKRQQWIAGRLAARQAVRALGKDMGALLTDARGAPIAPNHLAISISHKGRYAVAIASRGSHGSLGIDLEDIGRDRRHIAPKILREEELRDVQALPEERQWLAVLLRFSLKEAIYKALAPRLQRYIAFHEASICGITDGSAEVQLCLDSNDGPKTIEALYEWAPEGLITTVRARWP